MRPQYNTAPAIPQQQKQKKLAGPPTPATTKSGKKFRKTKPAAEKKPARLTARGPWATAHGARPKGHGSR